MLIEFEIEAKTIEECWGRLSAVLRGIDLFLSEGIIDPVDAEQRTSSAEKKYFRKINDIAFERAMFGDEFTKEETSILERARE